MNGDTTRGKNQRTTPKGYKQHKPNSATHCSSGLPVSHSFILGSIVLGRVSLLESLPEFASLIVSTCHPRLAPVTDRGLEMSSVIRRESLPLYAKENELKLRLTLSPSRNDFHFMKWKMSANPEAPLPIPVRSLDSRAAPPPPPGGRPGGGRGAGRAESNRQEHSERIFIQKPNRR